MFSECRQHLTITALGIASRPHRSVYSLFTSSITKIALIRRKGLHSTWGKSRDASCQMWLWWLCRSLLSFGVSSDLPISAGPSHRPPVPTPKPSGWCSLLGTCLQLAPWLTSSNLIVLLSISSWSSQDLVTCTRISHRSVFSARYRCNVTMLEFVDHRVVEGAIISGSEKSGSTRPYWRPKLRFHFCSCRSIGQQEDSGMTSKANNPGLLFKIIVRPESVTGCLPLSSPIQGKLPLWFATSDRNRRLLMHVGAILVYDDNDHFLRTTIDSPLLLSVPVLSPTVDM